MPDTDGHEHQHGDDGHAQGHHGHQHDRGLRGALRYLRFAPSMWRSEVNDAVVDLVAPRHGECVIDIGAGMGAGTARAARAGASVVAVEPTPFLRWVLTARRLFRPDRTRIHIVDGAAEQLRVADHSTDAVLAVNSMHHWVDPSRGATEIARVLRPGGRVVLVDEDFVDPTHPEHDRFDDHSGDDETADEHHHGFTMVDAQRMGELLADAGLVDVDAAKRPVADRPSIVVTARQSD